MSGADQPVRLVSTSSASRWEISSARV